MRDMHCHILPGVDDGAQDLEESMAMFEAARRVGITSITCTPHCRDPYFDYLGMWRAFRLFERAVHEVDPNFPLQMGFEVNHRKLMDLGMDWVERLHFDGTNEFLLELSVSASPSRFGDYERTIFQLQGMGLDVIIAHPERYLAIQKDIGIARELANMGCKLQASTDFVKGGRLGREKRPALKMMREGLYTYYASDAHRVKHYKFFDQVHGMLR
ncbi:MAG: phosphoesterase [Coriobacteriales bacterium]|nr:phosphoesterase [Coriobacteriales bacterium]